MNIQVTFSRLNTMTPQRPNEYRANIINASIETPDVATQRELLSLVDVDVLKDWMAENGLTVTESKVSA